MTGPVRFSLRLDTALHRRWNCRKAIVVLHDVPCEVCGDNIHYYIGRPEGILCASCGEINWDACFCGNTTPGDWSGAEDYEPTELP